MGIISEKDVVKKKRTEVKSGKIISEGDVVSRVEQPQEQPSLLQRIATGSRVPLETAGLLGGGALGTAAGPIGTVGGAGLGFQAGREVSEILQQLTGVRQPQPLGRELLEAGKGVATGGATELIGGPAGVGRGVKALTEYFSRKISPGAKEAISLLEPRAALEPRKITRPFSLLAKTRGKQPVLTVGQATESRAIDILENASDKSLFGGGLIDKQVQGVRDLVETGLNEFASEFTKTASRNEARTIIQTTLRGEKDAFNAAARNLYKQVDKLTTGVNVDITSTKTTAQNLLAQMEKGIGANAATKRMLKEVIKKPNVVDFETAHIMRSDLGKVQAQATELIPDQAKGAAKLLFKNMDNAIGAADTGLSNEAKTALKNAGTFWKDGKRLFNDRFIVKVAELDKDAVLDTILNSKEPIDIKKLRELIVDRGKRSDIWGEVQGKYFQNIVDNAIDDNNILKAGKMLKAFKTTKPDTLNAFFPKNEHKHFKRFVDALRLAEKKEAGLPGGIAIQLIQIGQLGTAAALLGFSSRSGEVKAPEIVAALLILGGPAAFARATTNPRIVDLLIDGLSKPTADTIGKLATLMTKEGIDTQVVDNAIANQLKKPRRAKLGPLSFKSGFPGGPDFLERISQQAQQNIGRQKSLSNMLRKTGTITP